MSARRGAAADERDGDSVLSGMSQPLLVDDDTGDCEGNDDTTRPTYDADYYASLPSIRKNFLRMSTLFAVNHGCTVSCVGLANAVSLNVY